MKKLRVRVGSTKRGLAHLGTSTLMALAFGLVAGYYVSMYYVGHFSVETCLWSIVLSLAINYSIGALCAVTEALLRPRLGGLPRTQRLWFEVPTSVAAHILGFLVPTFLIYRLLGFPLKSFLASFRTFLIIFLAIHEFEYLVRFYRELKEAEVREERLKALAAQSELKALKAQINPHFLFNTLNTIAQLIHTDPARAEATIEWLAAMFRYVLVGSDQGEVPLGEELHFVNGYLDIEGTRLGQRLRVTRQVAPESLSVSVPSLILQPLVENAVRHGQGADGSVDLTIRVWPHGDEVMITVADQGPGMPKQRSKGALRLRSGQAGEQWSKGHGLRNVDERLRKTYGEEYGLEIRDNEPKGAVVIVHIPL